MNVLEQLRTVLAAEFEIEPDLITMDAHLMDAIDMLARLRDLTGADLPAEGLKQVRTVGDVVALVNGS